jgi:hypothetical protein
MSNEGGDWGEDGLTAHLRDGVGGDLDDEAAELPDARVILRAYADAGGDLGEGLSGGNPLREHPDVEGVRCAVVRGGAAYDVVLWWGGKRGRADGEGEEGLAFSMP